MSFVGEFKLSVPAKSETITKKTVREDIGPLAFSLDNLLSDQELKSINQQLHFLDWVPVGINGMKGNFNPETDKVGSLRASSFSTEFASFLSERIQPHFAQVTNFKNVPTDTDGHASWRFSGVNPLMRFVRYPDGGELVGHYDAPYVYNQNKTTLLTIVIYMHRDQSTTGGRTRFLNDQQTVPFDQRDFSDWGRVATEDEVRIRIEPNMGGALVFPHRMLHDSEKVSGGEKWLLRTDLEFERV